MKPSVKIKIDTPCTEDWNAMQPAARGRFCDSCAKNVVDFTGMTDSQIAKYLLQHNGSICGRVKSTQLHRALELEKEVGPAQVKAISWFLRAAVLVGLTLPGKANANPVVEAARPFNGEKGNFNEPIPRQVTITGTVTDSISGEAIKNARLVITGIADTLAADSTGNFTALINVADSSITEIKIMVMADSYNYSEQVFTIPQNGILLANIKLNKLVIGLAYNGPDTITSQPWIVTGLETYTMGVMISEPQSPLIFTFPPYAIVDSFQLKPKPVFGNKFAGLYKAIKEEDQAPDYYLYLLYMSFAVSGIYLAYKKWFSK